MVTLADDQPVVARPLGDAIWITSLITPDNPDVRLKYEELTRDLITSEEKIIALWHYVAGFKYKETVGSITRVGSTVARRTDTWFYPAETMRFNISNCANRAFLLASLIKNEIPEAYCAMGYLNLDGIGGHAWVKITLNDQDYILETTQPNLEKAIIPVGTVDIYEEVLKFDDQAIYTTNYSTITELLNGHFGLCAIDFLRDYLCERCLELEA